MQDVLYWHVTLHSGEAPKPTSSNTGKWFTEATKGSKFNPSPLLLLAPAEVLNKVTAQLDDLKHQQNKLFAVVHIGK